MDHAGVTWVMQFLRQEIEKTLCPHKKKKKKKVEGSSV